LEDAQVLHHPEAGHVDALAQLAQRLPVPPEQPVQQLAPVGVGEGLEHVVHAPLCDQMVTCQPAGAPKGAALRVMLEAVQVGVILAHPSYGAQTMKPIPTEVVFLSARRTPFGTYGGSLKDVSATELGVHAAKAAIAQSGVKPEDIDNVVFGNVVQTSPDAIYLARHVGLRSGIPQLVP